MVWIKSNRGAKMINRILPLLNTLLPASLAIKGLSKIDPRLEKFLSYSAASGYSADAALNFLRDKIQSEGESVEQQRLAQGKQQETLRPDERAAQQRIQETNRVPNTLSKVAAGGIGALTGLSGMRSQNQGKKQDETNKSTSESSFDPLAGLKEFPELMQFIASEQASGGNAQSIASKARKSAKLSKSVNAIEKNIGEPFENLLSRLLGQSQQTQQTQQATQQGSQGKQQFLQGLNQLGQMIQGLKGK